MPPKKPKVAAEDEFAAAPVSTRKLIANLGVEDLNLPKSMVSRIAKGVLPGETSIQRDALLAISKSSTVFVSYLAAHANDRATLNNKKTIQPEDVFQALKDLEFDDFVDRCQEEEKRYATMLNDKRNNYRHRVKEQQQRKVEETVNVENTTDGNSGMTPMVIVESRPHDAQPASKKARLSEDVSLIPDNDDGMDEVMSDEVDDVVEDSEEDEDNEGHSEDNELEPQDDGTIPLEEDNNTEDDDIGHDLDDDESSDSD